MYKIFTELGKFILNFAIFIEMCHLKLKATLMFYQLVFHICWSCLLQDLCKYMRGEFRHDTAHSVLRSVIGYGLERLELRDEIYCQLMRLTNDNPHQDYEVRVWDVLCLCSVSFAPSTTLSKVSDDWSWCTHLSTELRGLLPFGAVGMEMGHR